MADLHRSLTNLKKSREPKRNILSGQLGIPINGAKTVNVVNRPGYVYVRLQGNTSELIQAYNDQVSPVYDLPVLVERDETKYVVTGRNVAQYTNWGTSPYLPAHGTQHSLNGVGGDIVWVYSPQFMPLNVFPSGSSLSIYPYIYNWNGDWKIGGGTGTTNVSAYLPADNAKQNVLLLYLAGNTSVPTFLEGTEAPLGLTDAGDLMPYLPDFPQSLGIPLAMVLVPSGTTTLGWSNIYDIRQYYWSGTSGSFSGGGDVFGSASGTSGHLVVFDGDGYHIKDGGPVDASTITYTPDDLLDWNPSVPTVRWGLTELASRLKDYMRKSSLADYILFGNATQEYDISGVTWVSASSFEPTAASHLLPACLIAIQTQGDGQYLAVRELTGAASATNPLTTSFTFKYVDIFDTVNLSAFYSGSTGTMVVEMYNFDTTSYDVLTTLSGTSTDFGILEIPISNYYDYLSNGSAIINFRAVDAGTATHYLKVDHISLVNHSFREVLTENRTYYVRTNGVDTNTGLVNDAAGAFLTIQHAVDVVATLDIAGYTVTIQLADATYTENVQLKEVVGYSIVGNLIIKGNTATPANVINSPVGVLSKAAFYSSGIQSEWLIMDMQLSVLSGSATACSLVSDSNSRLWFGNIIFAQSKQAHLRASAGGVIQAYSSYSITGNATFHGLSSAGGILRVQLDYLTNLAIAVTITPTVAFTAFYSAQSNSAILANGSTYTAAASTGKHFDSHSGGLLVFVAAETGLGGDALGTLSSGGIFWGAASLIQMGNMSLLDGSTIGQAAGPLLTFNDSANVLSLEGGAFIHNDAAGDFDFRVETNTSGSNALNVDASANSLQIMNSTAGLVGFHNTAPNNQAASTEDLGAVLAEKGFRAAGGAYYTGKITWTKITADSIAILGTHGTLTGAVATLRTEYDDSYLQVHEVAHTPGFDFQVEFVSVTTFNWVRILGAYVGQSAHGVAIQLYNFVTSVYDTFNTALPFSIWSVTAGEQLWQKFDFFPENPASYIGTAGADAGDVRVRFSHPMAGNANDHLYLDVVALYL